MNDIEKVLKNYNINIKNIESLEKGYVSKKWGVLSDSNILYILKKIDKQDLERIKFILDVESQLKEYCPEIQRTKSGLVYCINNNDIYYMYKYIESDKININLKRLNELGFFLATLHKEMSKMNTEKNIFLKIEDNYDILCEYLDYYIKNNNEEYIKILNYKIAILKRLKYNNINLKKLSEQVVHGDFYKDNILYNKGQYKIIDFDQCCYFYKEYEILRGMFMLCLNEDTKEHIFKKMRSFIAGYYKNGNINSAQDAYNLYLYIQANSLSSLKPGSENNNEKYKFAIKRYHILSFLNENEKDILQILEGE